MDPQDWFLSCVLSFVSVPGGPEGARQAALPGRVHGLITQHSVRQGRALQVRAKETRFLEKRAHQSKGGREERKGDFITWEIPIFYFSSKIEGTCRVCSILDKKNSNVDTP
jgi:hypothetical protein